jgi:hypothetical protein
MRLGLRLLQDWFTSTQQMLETAAEIRERAAA